MVIDLNSNEKSPLNLYSDECVHWAFVICSGYFTQLPYVSKASYYYL